MKRAKRFISIMVSAVILLMVFPKTFLPLTVHAETYNPSAATEYARQYWSNYNPNYSNYNSIGGDCANFVSQCLHAGGLAMTSKWYWYSYDERSASWASCSDMYNYFKEAGYTIIENPSNGQVKEGNPVLYWRNGRWGHAAICIGNNSDGVPVVAAHNNDRWGAGWTLGYSKTCTILINGGDPIPDLVTPTISTDKDTYTVGDTVNISWAASPAGSNLSHYWLVISGPNGEYPYAGTMNLNTSYSFVASQAGDYTITTYATPKGSLEGEGSLTDTKTISVQEKEIAWNMSLSTSSMNFILGKDQKSTTTLTVNGDMSKGGIVNTDDSGCKDIVDITYNNDGKKTSTQAFMSFTVTPKAVGSGNCLFYVTVNGTTVASVNLSISVTIDSCKVRLYDDGEIVAEYGIPCGTVFNDFLLPDMSRTGYTFEGWYTAESGGTKYSVGSKVPEILELNLYAHWKENKCSVTWNSNFTGGSVKYAEYAWGDTFGAAADTPPENRPGYTFEGWYTGSIKITADTLVPEKSELTLYAHWKIDSVLSIDRVELTLDELIAADYRVTVPVRVSGSGGWFELGYGASWDTDELTVSRIRDGDTINAALMECNTISKILHVPVVNDEAGMFWAGVSAILYDDNFKQLYVEDGIVSYITFTVTPSAAAGDTYVITALEEGLDGTHGTISTADSRSVEYNVSNGAIVIKENPVYGDINQDGKTTVTDAVALQKYLITLKRLTSEQLSLADINGDGRVNTFDLSLLKQLLK